MGSGSQATEQKFPFPKEVVLEALGEVLPNLGLQATHVDMFIGRIDVSAGMSAFSWGERVTIVVDDLEPGVCVVRIESSLKVGANLPGNHRHHKNFSRIIYALSDYLQLGEKGERKIEPGSSGSTTKSSQRSCVQGDVDSVGVPDSGSGFIFSGLVESTE
nr:hypothetical protein [Pseudomonas sp. BIGb0427]